jgi:hypothetical protein
MTRVSPFETQHKSQYLQCGVNVVRYQTGASTRRMRHLGDSGSCDRMKEGSAIQVRRSKKSLILTGGCERSTPFVKAGCGYEIPHPCLELACCVEKPTPTIAQATTGNAQVVGQGCGQTSLMVPVPCSPVLEATMHLVRAQKAGLMIWTETRHPMHWEPGSNRFELRTSQISDTTGWLGHGSRVSDGSLVEAAQRGLAKQYLVAGVAGWPKASSRARAQGLTCQIMTTQLSKAQQSEGGERRESPSRSTDHINWGTQPNYEIIGSLEKRRRRHIVI